LRLHGWPCVLLLKIKLLAIAWRWFIALERSRGTLHLTSLALPLNAL
jgi:hypothetical protein